MVYSGSPKAPKKETNLPTAFTNLFRKAGSSKPDTAEVIDLDKEKTKKKKPGSPAKSRRKRKRKGDNDNGKMIITWTHHRSKMAALILPVFGFDHR